MKITDLTEREPLAPAAAAHVLLGYGLLEGVEALPFDPPTLVVLAVYSLAVTGVQYLTRKHTWSHEGVQIEKAQAQAAVLRARNQAATPELFE